MASDGSIPPPLAEVPENQKFDGGVKVTWTAVRRKIVNALKVQGLHGYIDGSIPKPTTVALAPPQAGVGAGATHTPTPDPTTHTTPTAVYSTTPLTEEWNFRNDRAKAVIESYMDDLPLLLPGSDEKTAKEIIDELEVIYGARDDLNKVITERRLRAYTFKGAEPLDEFFKRLRELRKEAMLAGNNISDETFRQIVLAAFPGPEFDAIISNIITSSN
jgi:hypothetical protein